jgi:hypothetical protein
MIPGAKGFKMTDLISWKISLPASAPRPLDPIPQQAPQTTGERDEGRAALAGWLPASDLAFMKDKDIRVLAGETSTLMASASHHAQVWKFFPNASDIPAAERLIADFQASLSQEAEQSEAARGLSETLGLDWNSPAMPNIEAAEKLVVRYAASMQELDRLARSLLDWTGTAPRLSDAAFIAAISASLRAADITALSRSSATRSEVDHARTVLDELDRISADLVSEFSFDPGEHSIAVFGGISRAFSQGRAQDFLSAARKLGINPKGPEQAQRGAALLKKYITGLNELAPAATDSSHQASILARARLAQSIQRRADILSIDEKLLSPSVRDIDLLDFSRYPGDGALALNPDTRKLIEDNAAMTAEATVADLSAGVHWQTMAISMWIERTRRGASLLQPTCTHDQVEEVLRANPAPVTNDAGARIGSMSDLEALDRHVQWLHEAAMLPLSDEQLDAFVAHAGTKSAR